MEKLVFRYAVSSDECTQCALLTEKEYREKGNKPYLTSGRHIGALQLMDEKELRGYGAVIVDEAHLVDRAQAEFLVHVAHGLDVPVICIGMRCSQERLGLFSMGIPFEGAMLLMAWADEVGSSLGEEPVQESGDSLTEQVEINPILMEFMDAKTYAQKLDIFVNRLKFVADDDMVNTVAVVLDVEIREGDLARRLLEVEKCLETFVRFECDRLR